ncbi:hypothetical protein PQR75_46320 [Paraburkholderia fungorum]
MTPPLVASFKEARGKLTPPTTKTPNSPGRGGGSFTTIQDAMTEWKAKRA